MVKKEHDRYPYPTARITRHLRKEIEGMMISSKVKMATNQFLGDITDIVAGEMDAISDKTIQLGHFEKASKPYACASRIEEEEAEVVKELENMRLRMDKLIRDFRAKFEIIDENEFKVGHDELSVPDDKDKPKSIGEMTIEELDV